MCFGEQFRDLLKKLGLFTRCVAWKDEGKGQRNVKLKLHRNHMSRSFRENDRQLVAITSASPTAVVTATKLWLVVLEDGVCDLTIIVK